MLHAVAPEHYGTTRSGLPCLWAASPICIGVYIGGRDRLFLKLIHQAGCCVEEPTHAFKSFPGLCSGLCHPSAHLFACELRVNAVRSEVVAPSSRSAKGCREVGCKFVVSLELSEADLDTRGSHTLPTFQTTFSYKALDLTRVGLILYAILAPTDYPVQDSPLLGVRRPGPEPRLRCEFVLVRDRRF